LPIAYVFQPCSFSTSAIVPVSNGIRTEKPGKPAEPSMMQAMLLLVALHRVRRLERVGEQSAVVSKLE
jgi:hypothetical protein